MNKNLVRWILAVLVTLTAATYQRLTGPTHPLRGSAVIGDETVHYSLPRSHGGDGDQDVDLAVADKNISASLYYRRLATADVWTTVPMLAAQGTLRAALPHQPPAGKLEYVLHLERGDSHWQVPASRAVVIRFRGGVPAGILVPHVVLMFFAMLFSSVAGIEAFACGTRLRGYTQLAVGSLLIGGLVLGPIVQKYAFGELWTGVPYGYDLTDNKTLIAAAVWLAALAQVLRRPPLQARYWVIAAAAVLLIIFSIPHSALGSQLDYASGQIKTGAAAPIAPRPTVALVSAS